MKRTVLLLALVACPQQPQPAPNRDAADGAQVATPQSACDHLAAIGCTDGASVQCASTLARVVDAGLTRVDLACLVNASSKDAARACGGVSCP